MQTEKSQPEGKRIMPETRLSVDTRVGISRSSSVTDVWLFFFTMTLKIIIYRSFFLSILTFYVAKRPFPNVFCVFSDGGVTSES